MAGRFQIVENSITTSMNKGNYDQAKKILDREIVKTDAYPAADLAALYELLAWAYAGVNDDVMEAFDAVTKSNDIRGSTQFRYFRTYFIMGCVLRKQSSLDEAIALSQEGLERAKAAGEKDWIHKYKKLIKSLKDEKIVLEREARKTELVKKRENQKRNLKKEQKK